MPNPISTRLATAKRAVKDKIYGKTKDTAGGVQQLEMADARRGVIYFLGNTKAARTGLKLDFGIVSNFVGNTEVAEDVGKGALWLVEKVSVARGAIDAGKQKVQAVKDWAADKLKPLTDMIQQYFGELLSKLRLKYGYLLDGCDALTECVGWLTSTLTKTLADAIPGWGYVQSAADIYSGAKTAIQGAWKGLQQLYSGYGVQLLGGHPSIIANMLGRHALAMVAGGLKDIGIASGKIAMMGAADAAAGVGALVSVVSEILLKIAGLVERLVQRFLLNRALRQASEQWSIRDGGAGLIADHKKFSEWFQSAVIATPVIAALTLNSGFAAHPYRFLQLLDGGGQVVSQSQFDSGVAHIDKLKSIGADYVRAYIDAYSTTFESPDKLVQARLQEIITGKGIQHVAEPAWQNNPIHTPRA